LLARGQVTQRTEGKTGGSFRRKLILSWAVSLLPEMTDCKLKVKKRGSNELDSAKVRYLLSECRYGQFARNCC